MRLKAITMLMLGAAAVHAAGGDHSPAQGLTVYIYGEEAVPTLIRAFGEGAASRVLAGVGVRVNWRHTKPRASQAQIENAMVVEIKGDCPSLAESGAIASAREFEGSTITVLYCRMRWAERNPKLAPQLFAHVLIHEITHNLQMLDRHSATGVMKAHWNWVDYGQMSVHPLPFEPVDVELIHLGMKTRGAGPSHGFAGGE